MGTFNFRTVGSGTHVVTALHPLSLNGGWYDPIAAATATDFTWVIPDMPGHGSSDYGPDPITLDGLGAGVVAIWDELGIARSALVGISLGGMVAQSITDRARDRVWAQVLMGTTHAYPQAAFAPARERIAMTRRAADMGELVDATVARWFTAEQLQAGEPLVAQARADVVAGAVSVHADFLEAMLGLNYVGTSSAWSPPPPTLVVGGWNDLSTPVPVVEAMAAAIDDAELTLIEGGHLAAFEHPDEAARLLEAFLTKHLPSTAA